MPQNTDKSRMLTCPVKRNVALNDVYHLIDFTLPIEGWSRPEGFTFEAGQFVQVDCRPGGTMLRRPISIYRYDETSGMVSMIVQRVGKGSTYLTQLHPGDLINIVGPLGNSFSIDRSRVGQRPLLVAGGVGLAPMMMLASKLHAVDKTIRPHLLVGARTAELIVLQDEIARLGCTYGFTTDDGSLGTHGNVLSHPSLSSEEYSMVYTCGPRPMMRAVRAWAMERGLNGEASLENLMACGVGACLCCVENTVHGGNVCTCTEGPVFSFDDLIW